MSIFLQKKEQKLQNNAIMYFNGSLKQNKNRKLYKIIKNQLLLVNKSSKN